MPCYEYLDTRTGKHLDLILPVEFRDSVPEHLKRIEVPSKVHYVRGVPRDTDSDVTVPRAFRQLEDTKSYREIERGTGFSRDQIRKIWDF